MEQSNSKVEPGKSSNINDINLSRFCFEKWHQKCATRSLFMEHALFNGSSSEESETDTAEQNHPDAAVVVQDKKASGFRWTAIFQYRLPSTFNPENDNLYFFWQFLSTLSLMYNAIFVPLRSTFSYQTKENLIAWLVFDYAADIIYLVDILLFQRHRQFLEGGCVVDDPKRTKAFYYSSWRFKRDLIAILPTDLLYFGLGINPIVRVNRFFKTDSYFEFNNMFEMMLKQAHVFRVVRTTAYLLYVIHLDACLYFYISYLKRFASSWGYDMQGVPYIRCYFWAFMTITTIGNVPDPTSTSEYILQLLHYFFGLFIFSIVIGQVRDSVQAASAEVEAYRLKKNSCLNYVQKNNIPAKIQNKVRLWFEYTWNTQRILDENALLQQMPGKMHTEIAINVHMDVLSRVELFKQCDKQLLYDLLVKLKPILYLPGDYVCRKGAVGREMFIITNGMVQVVGETPSHVFASLHPGTAFGEISLLAIGGGNRRTANIYSPGYTTLFALYKQDFNDVLLNHPGAQLLLKKKAKKMLNRDKVKKKPIIVSSAANKSMHKTNLGFGAVNAFLKGLKTKKRQ